MVLWTKLWYYTENYETTIIEVKKHGKLPKTKTKKLCFIMEKIWKYINIMKFLNKGSLMI